MQEKVSISLYASIGGVVAAILTAAVTHAIWGLGLTGMGWAGRTLCLTILLVFQISGLTTGISERSTTLGKTGLVTTIVVITAAVTSFILFIWPHLDLHIFILMLIPVPTILMGVLAGGTAVRLQSKPSLKIWKSLLILWITPSVWCVLLISIPVILGGIFKGNFNYEHLARWVTAVTSILFGPWATLAAKLGSWPNAGEFFSLPAAVILTVILAGLAAAAIRVRNCTVQGLAVIAFASFTLVWALVGIGQLLNCTS
ncbi:MAG: hypothetical protein WC454_09935 [Phycisphaerae bacterium]